MSGTKTAYGGSLYFSLSNFHGVLKLAFVVSARLHMRENEEERMRKRAMAIKWVTCKQKPTAFESIVRRIRAISREQSALSRLIAAKKRQEQTDVLVETMETNDDSIGVWLRGMLACLCSCL